MLHMSKTSKLDNIRSWSLQALTTCPGSIAEDGGLVDPCKGCYATGTHIESNNAISEIGARRFKFIRPLYNYPFELTVGALTERKTQIIALA